MSPANACVPFTLPSLPVAKGFVHAPAKESSSAVLPIFQQLLDPAQDCSCCFHQRTSPSTRRKSAFRLILPRLSSSLPQCSGSGTDDSMAIFDLSVIIPAHDEEAWIDRCLTALIGQDATSLRIEIIVVANACRDRTVPLAKAYIAKAEARGWAMRVLDQSEGGKLRALNTGDRVAGGRARLYLDADIACDPGLIAQICKALSGDPPLYATGRLAIAPANSWITRAYASVWRRLPFVRGGAVGAGLFAVNPTGRARWGDFPAIISDDTFVRLQFAPEERIEVPARYHWPMVEGFANLVRVRRRQDAGVAELRRLYPDLFRNEAKLPLTPVGLLAIAARTPVGFLVYLAVHVAVRLRPATSAWTRGR
jgi:hypothetical protein